MAIATAAGAAGSETVTAVAFTPQGATTNSFGSGATGTVAITGTGFAADGGNVTVTSNAPGLTFSLASESNATSVSADFASTAATVPGTYSITVTDDNGSATLTSAFTVDAAPTITAISPAVLSQGNPATPITITGTGFAAGATVNFTSDVNGTPMKAVVGAITSTSITVTVTPVNAVNNALPATAGTFDVTVTNTDGGTTTDAKAFTITSYGIQAVSPSALPVPTTGSLTTTVTINGSGFEAGATVSLGTCAGTTVGSATVTSATTVTVPITLASGSAVTRCAVTVTNPTVGGNGATQTAAGALGIGEAGDLAPIITASSLTTGTAINAGDPATAITFTGEGFSQYTIGGGTYDMLGNSDGNTTVSACTGNSGTSLTCEVAAVSDATAGPHTAALFNDGTEGDFANAFSVAGPVITSASPAALAVGAPVGTVVTLTGTGFVNGMYGGTDCTGVCDIEGNVEYVSATSANLVVTSTPGVPDVTGGDYVYIYAYNTNGDYVYAPDFPLAVDAAPTVTGLAYGVTGTTGIGAGATAQPVVITGTGFQSGAKIGSFTNGNGAADTNVTATVTSVNVSGTQIKATIAVAAGDTNPAVGFTVTNPDGGTASVLATQSDAIVLDAGPTVSAVSPSTATPSATNAFTITGTGFQAGATVTASSDGTCGAATVASSTSLTVSCTFGAEGSAAVTLSVTNADGGSTTTSAVLPAATTPPAPSFHVSAVHGSAVHGKTVTLTITGTGFYGQPRITSTGKGVKAVVTKDNGHALTVRVSTPANVKGWHTFTVTLANGKSGKVNYQTK